jgi:Transposase DDE domain
MMEMPITHQPQEAAMCQSQPVYHESPALALLQPWMLTRLPKVVDPIARQHIIQLAAGIFERQSALVTNIAKASAFQANTDSSNETQVRRILRDERLFLASVYYPFIQQLLQEMAPTELYLTIDESRHLNDFGIFGVGLATDGMSIPLGWILYATDEAWAEDARDLLATLAHYLPRATRIIVLADRIHTGEPFLACLETLGWDYVFRASTDTQIETSRGWKALRALTLHIRRARFFQQVRIWKGGQRRTNVSCSKLPCNGHRPVIWYLVSSLRAAQQRFVEYACRWWQECGWKGLKSALFDWERGRITDCDRVDVLLIGISCAIWAMWLLGRSHEHVPIVKPTTTTPQPRRKSIIQEGISAFTNANKKHRPLTLATPPQPRVLDYVRTFAPLTQEDVMH